MIKLEIEYRTLIKSEKLCDKLWINKYAWNEWIVWEKDTVSISIDKYNIELLDMIKDVLDK